MMNRSGPAAPVFRRPVLPLVGGCPCGTIRYQVTARPLLLYACHCTDCQHASGGALAMNMPVRTEAFRVQTGEPKGWHRVSPSGDQTVSWFCGDCGGRIYGSRVSRPDTVNVRAGTLDDTSWLVPAAQIFVRSAQPWVQLHEAACHETLPPDFASLAKTWRAGWDAS
ncbi:MAG TPA: GFA family protein [Rhodopila sp.]